MYTGFPLIENSLLVSLLDSGQWRLNIDRFVCLLQYLEEQKVDTGTLESETQELEPEPAVDFLTNPVKCVTKTHMDSHTHSHTSDK